MTATEPAEPRLSVVILTWNRRDDVLETLRLVGAATPAGMPTETIVVDNGSADGTSGAIAARFPLVKVVSLATNVGASGWNSGFALAAAPWILSLDDDSSPEGAWLTDVPAAFTARPAAGIIACRVVRGPERRCLTAGWSAHRTSFIACGTLFSRRVFERVGMYDSRIFLYSHEKEFALRALAAGFEICYEPRFVVHHREARAHRSVSRYLTRGVEDTTYRLVRYYPLRHLPLALCLTAAWHLAWQRRHGWAGPATWLRVAASVWRGARKALPVRRPFAADVRRRIGAVWRSDVAARSALGRWAARLAPPGFFW